MGKNKKFTDKTLKRQKVFTNTMNCGKILLIVNLIQFIAFVLLTYHPLGFGIFVSPV